MTSKEKSVKKGSVARRELVIEMKGKLSEINSLCSAIGDLSNDYDLECDFK